MRKLLRAALFIVTLVAGARQTNAQTLDPTFAAIDVQRAGTVYNAVQQPDGKYLVGGVFTQVNGSPAVGLARLNANGTLDQAFTSTAACQSNIFKIRLLPNGQMVLQGSSITVGGQTFTSLAKLNADGTVATGFSVGSGAQPIADVAVQADGKILVSGEFTSFNGINSKNLVRLNADGTIDLNFTIALGAGFMRSSGGPASTVRGIQVQPDGKILVCGNFENYNGTGRSGLLRLNTDGTLDTSFNPLSSTSTTGASEVLAVALDPRNNYVLVYGYSFSSQQIVRLTPSGQLDTSFSLSAASTCLSFANSNTDEFVVDASGRVLLSGCFTDFGGAGGNSYVTRLLANGQPDSQFAIGQQLDGSVYSLQALANGDVLMGGAFGRYGSIRNVSLVQVNNNAQPLSLFRPVIMQRGTVNEVALQPDGKVLIGGQFWQINGQAAGNMARLNSDGTLDPSFQLTGVDGTVRKIAIQPAGQVVVAGEFSTVGSQAHTSPVVARLLANGSADVSFTAPAVARTSGSSLFNAIAALALQPDGGVLLGSTRLNMGGFISTLHRLLPTGSMDAAYASRVGMGVLQGSVASLLVLPTGKHYVGGSSSASGPGLVRLNTDGTLDNSFTPGIAPTGSSMVVRKLVSLPNNQVLAGGSFSSYNGAGSANLVRLDANGAVDASYVPPVLGGNGVAVLERYANGRVLVGGSFLTVDGVNRGPLVRLNPSGSYDASFSNAFNSSGIGALALQPDESIVVSGSFTMVGGQPREFLARLTAPNVLAVGSGQRATATALWPNPVRQQLHLALDATAKPQQLTMQDAFGRVVLRQVVTKTDLTLPVQHLPAGVYLLRVDYADGPVTRRVVVE